MLTARTRLLLHVLSAIPLAYAPRGNAGGELPRSAAQVEACEDLAIPAPQAHAGEGLRAVVAVADRRSAGAPAP